MYVRISYCKNGIADWNRNAEQDFMPTPAFISSNSFEQSTTSSLRTTEDSTLLYFVQDLRDLTVDEGSRTTLLCQLSGEPDTVTWRKDGQIMENSEEFVQTFEETTGVCKLVITEVYSEDQGTISCHASNKVSEATTSCRMTVSETQEKTIREDKPDREGYPPKFTKTMESLRIRSNEKLRLQVTVDGKPVPEFYWKFNGFLIDGKTDKRFKIVSTDRESILSCTAKPLAGEYTVTAVNPYGKCSSTVAEKTSNFKTLRAKSPPSTLVKKQRFEEEHYSSEVEYVEARPPKLIKAIPSCILRPSDTVILTVKVAANTPVTFRWFFENEELEDSENVRLFHGFNESSATIRHPKAGCYKVRATNRWGAATSAAYITIKGQRLKICTGVESGQSSHLNYEVLQKESAFPVARFGSVGHPITVDRGAISGDEMLTSDAEELKPSTLLLPPRFLQEVPELVITGREEEIILEVTVDAHPPAKFVWFMDEREIFSQEQSRIYSGRNKSRLIAKKPLEESRIKVVALNEAGSVMSSGGIRIRDEAQEFESFQTEETDQMRYYQIVTMPPVFKTTLGDLQVEKDEIRTLEVTTEAKPPAKVTWYFDDEKIDICETATIYETKNRSILTKKFDREGILKVVAENAAGRTATESNVSYIHKPDQKKVVKVLQDQMFAEAIVPKVRPEIPEKEEILSDQDIRSEVRIIKQCLYRQRPPEEKKEVVEEGRAKSDQIFISNEKITQPRPTVVEQFSDEVKVKEEAKVLREYVDKAPPSVFVAKKEIETVDEYAQTKAEIVIPKFHTQEDAGVVEELRTITFEMSRPVPPTISKQEIEDEKIFITKSLYVPSPKPYQHKTVHMKEEVAFFHSAGQPKVFSPRVEGPPPVPKYVPVTSRVMQLEQIQQKQTFRPATLPRPLRPLTPLPQHLQISPLPMVRSKTFTDVSSAWQYRYIKQDIYRQPEQPTSTDIAHFVTEEFGITRSSEVVSKPITPKTFTVEERMEKEIFKKRLEENLPFIPRFIKRLENQVVEEMEELIVEVEVEARPPAMFKWFVRGFEVKTNESIEVVETRENVSMIKIKKPVKQGVYRVVAINKVGMAESTAEIRLIKVPKYEEIVPTTKALTTFASEHYYEYAQQFSGITVYQASAKDSDEDHFYREIHYHVERPISQASQYQETVVEIMEKEIEYRPEILVTNVSIICEEEIHESTVTVPIRLMISTEAWEREIFVPEESSDVRVTVERPQDYYALKLTMEERPRKFVVAKVHQVLHKKSTMVEEYFVQETLDVIHKPEKKFHGIQGEMVCTLGAEIHKPETSFEESLIKAFVSLERPISAYDVKVTWHELASTRALIDLHTLESYKMEVSDSRQVVESEELFLKPVTIETGTEVTSLYEVTTQMSSKKPASRPMQEKEELVQIYTSVKVTKPEDAFKVVITTQQYSKHQTAVSKTVRKLQRSSLIEESILIFEKQELLVEERPYFLRHIETSMEEQFQIEAELKHVGSRKDETVSSAFNVTKPLDKYVLHISVVEHPRMDIFMNMRKVVGTKKPKIIQYLDVTPKSKISEKTSFDLEKAEFVKYAEVPSKAEPAIDTAVSVTRLEDETTTTIKVQDTKRATVKIAVSIKTNKQGLTDEIIFIEEQNELILTPISAVQSPITMEEEHIMDLKVRAPVEETKKYEEEKSQILSRIDIAKSERTIAEQSVKVTIKKPEDYLTLKIILHDTMRTYVHAVAHTQVHRWEMFRNTIVG
uniref:Ig-like domain-containing protein n=1 Tax=Romanomermis culicivorax TaxID=13658 RepID=A0A915LAI7_ROMCU